MSIDLRDKQWEKQSSPQEVREIEREMDSRDEQREKQLFPRIFKENYCFLFQALFNGISRKSFSKDSSVKECS